MSTKINIQVKNFTIGKKRIENKLEKIFNYLKLKNSSVNLHVVGSRRIKSLNLKFRAKNRPTDVLSFSYLEGDLVPSKEKITEIGEIFICPEVLKNQAKIWGVTFEEEFYRMLIHGVLHLLGYDHKKKEDELVMFSLQEKMLGKIL